MDVNFLDLFNFDLFSDSSDSSSSEADSENENLQIIRYKHYIRDVFNPFEKYNDIEFRIRYRFSKQSTMYALLPLVESYLQRSDNRGLPISPVIQLRVSADLAEVSVPTVSRVVLRVTNLLASYFHKFIGFPSNEAHVAENGSLFKKLGYGEGGIGLPNISGAIDCTHIRLTNVNLHGETELFRNRKGFYFLNVQAIVGPRMEFLDLVPEWPGSQHDSTIFKNSRAFIRYQHQEIAGILIGDKGYPALTFLLTPFRNPQIVEQERYNEIQSHTRQVVERAFGVWKRRFPCLSKGLTLKIETCTSIVVACAVLHNLSLIYNEVLPESEMELLNESHHTSDNENYEINEIEAGDGFLLRERIVQELFA
ncbi:putative nuclease HARBI1 [Prorops nasuta]|uniref:putative nuclease HARBI1 n=1 Tax=Prorops nasuta TaxID=863751 RepID=UPI0034CFCED9